MEVARIADCAPAASLLEVARMQALVENWPSSGWTDPVITRDYRLALLRGIAIGHFVRKTVGAN